MDRAMANRRRSKWAPLDYAGIGSMLALLGGAGIGVGFGLDSWLLVVVGVAAAVPGSLLLMIGVVALGVLVGTREAGQD